MAVVPARTNAISDFHVGRTFRFRRRLFPVTFGQCQNGLPERVAQVSEVGDSDDFFEAICAGDFGTLDHEVIGRPVGRDDGRNGDDRQFTQACHRAGRNRKM